MILYHGGIFVGETSERGTGFAVAWGDREKLCCSIGIRPMTGKFPSSPSKYHHVLH